MKELEKINVLIADDSALMRRLITNVLAQDELIEVVGYASDGDQALQLTKELKPDVVLMDLTMGAYSGLYGIENIMESCPTPIVILSSVSNQNMEPIMNGLKLGAIDYLTKPESKGGNIHTNWNAIIEKIKGAKGAILANSKGKELNINTHEHTFSEETNYDIIVIGASTGGPRAIEAILTNLPENLSVPIVIIQHMPERFVQSFADRLNRITLLEVSVAKKNEILEAGKILLVPETPNTIIKNVNNQLVIDFTNKQFNGYNFPSINIFMLSVAKVCKHRSIGLILTGMGKDGIEGLKAIKDAGGYTIAEHKSTCIVYGMPKAAVDLGAVRQVVKLGDIGGFLVSCLA